MANFELINQNINSVLMALISNQNLCKLLHYPVDNPYGEPDIEDTAALLFDRIHPLLKVPDVQTVAGSFLNVYFDKYKVSSGNSGVKEGVLIFNVIVHNEKWRMAGTGMLRPYSILHEIDELFNNQRVVGIKKAQFDQLRSLNVNTSFSGYQVSYQVVSGN